MFDTEKYCGEEIKEFREFFRKFPNYLDKEENEIMFKYLKWKCPNINPKYFNFLEINFNLEKLRRAYQEVRKGKGNYRQRLDIEEKYLHD